MNIEPSISAVPPSEAQAIASFKADSLAKNATTASGQVPMAQVPVGSAPVIGVVAMMTVALPLVLGLQSHSCAANLAHPDAASGPRHPPAIAWHTHFDSACHLALAGNKMMMLAFYRDGCALCQQMEIAVYGRAAIIAAAQNIVPVRIDGEAQCLLASRYAVQKYPTIVWTDASGLEKHRFDGAPSGFELYQAMEHNY